MAKRTKAELEEICAHQVSVIHSLRNENVELRAKNTQLHWAFVEMFQAIAEIRKKVQP